MSPDTVKWRIHIAACDVTLTVQLHNSQVRQRGPLYQFRVSNRETTNRHQCFCSSRLNYHCGVFVTPPCPSSPSIPLIGDDFKRTCWKEMKRSWFCQADSPNVILNCAHRSWWSSPLKMIEMHHMNSKEQSVRPRASSHHTRMQQKVLVLLSARKSTSHCWDANRTVERALVLRLRTIREKNLPLIVE